MLLFPVLNYMVFHRSLRHEMFTTAAAVFTILLTVIMTVMLIRILGQAAAEEVASTDVMVLMGFLVLNYLPIILILTGYITVLLVVTRHYQYSEMVVWVTSGQSLFAWISPVLVFACPLLILITVLGFWVTPWANAQSNEYRERFTQRDDVSRISPGKFQESVQGGHVFFVEGVVDAQKVHNVFINIRRAGQNILIVAQEGRIEIDDSGDKFAVLSKGRRYDITSTTADALTDDQAEYKIMRFERYGLLLQEKALDLSQALSIKALPTSQLWVDHTPRNQEELLWRVSLPWMALCLMLLAIPLGFINPRVGRSLGILMALLVYVTYSNLVGLLQTQVVQEKLTFSWAWWPLHVAMLVLIGGLFAWRVYTNSAWHPSTWWGVRRHRRMKKK